MMEASTFSFSWMVLPTNILLPFNCSATAARTASVASTAVVNSTTLMPLCYLYLSAYASMISSMATDLPLVKTNLKNDAVSS